MIKSILNLLGMIGMLAPFLLLLLLNKKANLKPEKRSKQIFMPLITVLFCIIVGSLMGTINGWVESFLEQIPIWLESFSDWLSTIFGGALSSVGAFFLNLADRISDWLSVHDILYWASLLANTFILLAYLPFKKIMVLILSGICKDGKKFYEYPAKLVYYVRKEDGKHYVKTGLLQGVSLMKALYYATTILSIAGVLLTSYLYKEEIVASVYYPVFSILMVGEIYYILCGPVYKEAGASLEGEEDQAQPITNYAAMRNVLRRLFADKLMAENTTVNSSDDAIQTNDELITALEEDDETALEAYGRFMRQKAASGMDLDQNYLMSGLELLKGKSILFNNPFYYDLIPYIFYPMNRTILRHKKVLIVLGRHAIEDEVMEWCKEGLSAVTHIPYLWEIGVLNEKEQNLDVGIVTRSSVHDLAMHEANDDFLGEVEFVVIIEPSRLITTAQVGLNSLVRHCRRDGKQIVYCSTDKNCDGIVDSLSHVLMTSLEEVTATNRHKGTSSYMCWEADEEHLQHRLLPNLSRYMGVGSELSMVALKNQISKTQWYGGDAFPVLDMHWILKQYHYDLLHYASLPTQQATFDRVFHTSPNMWNAKAEKQNFITVEDENYNMFEAKRDFSTRASQDGFINIISTDYMMKDYMAANDGIFDADSKAIPYVVADYAHTKRNVIYRLCLQMCAHPILGDEIIEELALIDEKPGQDLIAALWHDICTIVHHLNESFFDADGNEELHIEHDGQTLVFSKNVIEKKRKYCYKTGEMEYLYSISNRRFIDSFLGDLCSAQYVAEDEKGEALYLGSELRGHVFQKYLPGQFFTFGGKYYEMLGLSADGRVMVRRAADHITGRPHYRQVRRYGLMNIADSERMGENRVINGVQVVRQFADINVQTPSYWQMNRYQDFSTAKEVQINNIPERIYRNKQVLKIDFSSIESATPEIVRSTALLMNELFRTMYADNQDMIVAVTSGDVSIPLTYSVSGSEEEPISDRCIYVIEDSQLDIGLLVSVERNLERIFSTICDYLTWHEEEKARSLNPPPVEPEVPSFELTEEEKKEEKKTHGIRGFFKRMFGAIGRFFKKIFGAIGRFFKKLFKRKPKKEKPDAPDKASAAEQPVDEAIIPNQEQSADAASTEVTAEDECTQTEEASAEIAEDASDEKDQQKSDSDLAEKENESETQDLDVPDDQMNSDSEASLDENQQANAEHDDAEEDNSEAVNVAEEDQPQENAEFDEEQHPEKKNQEAQVIDQKEEDVKEEQDHETDSFDHPVLFSISAPSIHGSIEESASAEPTSKVPAAEESAVVDGSTTEEPAAELVTEEPATEEPAVETSATDEPAAEAPALDEPKTVESVEADPATEEPAAELVTEESTAEEPAAEEPEGTIEFEPDNSKKKKDDGIEFHRKPYHERYYLLYGGTSEPEGTDFSGVLQLLETLGFGNSFLRQTRDNKHQSESIESGISSNRGTSHYCDFCGVELMGMEYEVLADGRERCMSCSRTAVKTEKEFKKIYKDTIQNLQAFYGITITVPVSLQMVNAKKLHQELGKSFVPTGNADGRILGVAIKSKKGYSILLENGSPRLSAIMTMVHELTHIWQYLNWDAKQIKSNYGQAQNLEVYEGMAKWSEIQYAYLLGEEATAKREEQMTRSRDDEYGRGFIKYAARYPLAIGTNLNGKTPFDDPKHPL